LVVGRASRFSAARLLCASLLLCQFTVLAQELTPIPLPKPQTDIGRPLMQVLNARKSTREFSTERLPLQMMSNLIWAAFGINRSDGRRTAPSARNWQEIDIYVATGDGVYVYDAKAHQLNPVLRGDVRGQTGVQDFVGVAAVNLVYVADLSKTGAPSPERDTFVAADAGFIAQNVYLFCASEGLAVVVRGLVNREALAKTLQLRPDQRIILTQSVGFPRK
jgi:nitroreductase